MMLQELPSESIPLLLSLGQPNSPISTDRPENADDIVQSLVSQGLAVFSNVRSSSSPHATLVGIGTVVGESSAVCKLSQKLR